VRTVDNCLHPKEKIEAMDDNGSSWKPLLQLKKNLKQNMWPMLFPNINQLFKSYKHHKLEIFGAGGERDKKYWNALLRQALIAQFITKDIENYVS